jgi:hypothetical protein
MCRQVRQARRARGPAHRRQHRQGAGAAAELEVMTGIPWKLSQICEKARLKHRDDEIARLKSKVGVITMDNELLYATIRAGIIRRKLIYNRIFKLGIALCPVWIVTHLSPFLRARV